MAKRFYDLALDTNSEAYLPVMLSLVKLYARSFWHTIRGGTEGLSFWGDDEEGKSLAWPFPRLDTDDSSVYGEPESPHEIDGSVEDPTSGGPGDLNEHANSEDDGPWYFGKAREQFDQRRRGHGSGAQYDEDDHVQFARDRRLAEEERDSDWGPEDYFDGAMRGGRREGGPNPRDEEFIETMAIAGLVFAVAGLIWLRRRAYRGVRRLQEEEEREDRQRGLFPAPEDPARQDWAVMR